ncbi:MAG: restriction endonuclease subunit R, partial [Anaerolineae bacterium]|nr:restriction endonuclease subunit R [Anaerolineae bacterium]
RRAKALEYGEYLEKIVDLTKQVNNPLQSPAYPSSINTRAKQALFDNLGNNEQLAIVLDAEIQRTKKDGWRGNRFKEKEVLIAIRKHIADDILAGQVFELVKNQAEY